MDDEIKARRARCTDSFQGNGLLRPAELLTSVPPDTVEDVYGDGGVVTDLERHIAELLGKPAAVFLPSGTMAQPPRCASTPTGGPAGRSSGTRTVTWPRTRARRTPACTSSSAGRSASPSACSPWTT